MSIDDNNVKNLWSLYYYNEDLFMTIMLIEKFGLRQVYNSNSVLCKFNNLLVNTYDIDQSFIDNLDIVKSYLQENENIKENCIDSKCRSIYDNIRTLYNPIISNPNCLDDTK